MRRKTQRGLDALRHLATAREEAENLQACLINLPCRLSGSVVVRSHDQRLRDFDCASEVVCNACHHVRLACARRPLNKADMARERHAHCRILYGVVSRKASNTQVLRQFRERRDACINRMPHEELPYARRDAVLVHREAEHRSLMTVSRNGGRQIANRVARTNGSPCIVHRPFEQGAHNAFGQENEDACTRRPNRLPHAVLNGYEVPSTEIFATTTIVDEVYSHARAQGVPTQRDTRSCFTPPLLRVRLHCKAQETFEVQPVMKAIAQDERPRRLPSNAGRATSKEAQTLRRHLRSSIVAIERVRLLDRCGHKPRIEHTLRDKRQYAKGVVVREG